ncbi:MAG: ATP-binding protein [candidate division KSB1 bacterium]|nr:ATP-binding protein [candidate division KSB1 bacterium]
MKLSFKIMSFVFLGIFVLLVIDGYLSVKREIALFTNDMRHDVFLLGHAMKQLVSEAWQHGGQSRALELIKNVNQDEPQIQIRWVWLDAAPGDPFAPRVSPARLDSVISGYEVNINEKRRSGSNYFYRYIPIEAENHRLGALELRESHAALNDYTHHTIIWSIVLTGSLLLVGGLLVWILSIRFVVRPLDKLMNKTQQIGAGNLSGDLVLKGHDELSDLAAAMNRMCGQLSLARETVRKETKARIAALEQLRHSERLATIGQLAAGMAHELGTPLNVVAGRAKLMASEDLKKEEIIENSRIIREQVDRMTRIMRQLLDFARRQPARRLPTDLRKVVRQVLDMLDAAARKNRVILALIENGEPAMIAIDQAQIQQVLTNLVMNGIQAMPNGGRLELGINVERPHRPARQDGEEKDYLAIRVRDEGTGISEENKQRIFEPFFTTKEVGKGTGLGLSIAHGIVEEHGGWIEVESELGKGSCFTVYLPMENKE